LALPNAAARRGFKMVLFTASRENTFVGGTCALPSAFYSYVFVTSAKTEVMRSVRFVCHAVSPSVSRITAKVLEVVIVATL